MESRKRCYLGVGLHAESASGRCRGGGGGLELIVWALWFRRLCTSVGTQGQFLARFCLWQTVWLSEAEMSLFSRQSHQAPGVGDGLRQQLGPRLAWTLSASQSSSQTPTSKGLPNALSRSMTRSRRDGDPSGKMCFGI